MANNVKQENQDQSHSSSTRCVQAIEGSLSATRRNDEQNGNIGHCGKTEAPNGGWGWIVMISAFLVKMIVDGFSFSSGLFYIELKHHFEASSSQTSLIFSVLTGTYHVIGPIVSMMIALFGWRRVTIFGASLATISFLGCTWSPNVGTMIVLYGLMGGIGMGFMYVTVMVSVGHYFTTKRSLALGISACGSGVGGLVLAPLVEFVIGLYGWRGALWILAGITLQGIPLGALLRPLADSEQERKLSDRPTKEKGDARLGQSHNKQSCCKVTSVFDIELFKSPSLLLYVTSCFLCLLGLYIPITYLPDYAEDAGHTSHEAAWLISTIGISCTIFRVVVGWLASRPWTDVIIINNAVLVTGGIATIFLSYYHSMSVLFVYSAVFGLTYGVPGVMSALIATELLGVEKLTSSYGLINAAFGLAVFIGVPIAGALVDSTGDYVVAFYFSGSVLVLSGAICFPLRRIRAWENKRWSRSVCSMDTGDTVIVGTVA